MNKKLVANILIVILLVAGAGGYVYSRTKLIERCEEVLKRYSENHACISTSRGNMVFELYSDEAPKSVEELKNLANEKRFYDGLEFYRVSKDFVVQGGLQDLQQKYFNVTNLDSSLKDKIKETENKFETEANFDKLDLTEEEKSALGEEGFKSNPALSSHIFEFGSLSFANAGPGTNSTEIFIVTNKDKDASNVKYLRGRFTNMGKLIEGEDVLRNINESEINRNYQYSQERPLEVVKIFEVRAK